MVKKTMEDLEEEEKRVATEARIAAAKYSIARYKSSTGLGKVLRKVIKRVKIDRKKVKKFYVPSIKKVNPKGSKKSRSL